MMLPRESGHRVSDMVRQRHLVVVRGPIAVGKTSAIQLLAGQMDKVAVVPIDWLRHMIAGSDPADTQETLLLACSAGALADSFYQAGYSVLIDGPLDDLEALDSPCPRGST